MNKSEPSVFGRGFELAIAFFLAKINHPTLRWDDLWQAQHLRAFTIAGAMKQDLLADIRAAVEDAITKGESYDAFKRRFKDIAEFHKWQHNGSPGWRSRVIWHTNVRVASSVGRWQQMTNPAIVEHMGYWMYDHTTILNPREQHKAWDGIVLRWNDQWWKLNWPPNGWGCNCRVVMLSKRMMERRGLTLTDNPPDTSTVIPPEWRYNPGMEFVQMMEGAPA